EQQKEIRSARARGVGVPEKLAARVLEAQLDRETPAAPCAGDHPHCGVTLGELVADSDRAVAASVGHQNELVRLFRPRERVDVLGDDPANVVGLVIDGKDGRRQPGAPVRARLRGCWAVATRESLDKPCIACRKSWLPPRASGASRTPQRKSRQPRPFSAMISAAIEPAPPTT